MGIEGSLTIDLCPGRSGAGRVAIDSSRPVHASRLFLGKGDEETLKLVPMLFSICGTAQASAAVRAFEQALGIRPVPGTEQVREGLVRLESVREHLWRILLDWPAFLAESPQQRGMGEVVTLQRDVRQTLCGDRDPFLPGAVLSAGAGSTEAGSASLATLVGESVFGLQPDTWLEIDSEEGLAAWAGFGVTAAARLIALVMSKGWSDIGRCYVESLPVLENGALHRAMQKDDFIERPKWEGHCYETTCLSRTDSTLLQSLQARYGNGLLVRLVARLTELATLSGELLPSNVPDEFSPADDGAGIGRATAARGELLHRVSLKDGVISDYRIVAPTEWNFHPQGVVAAGLASLQGGDIERQARLLINAIDPCVAYELRIG